MTKITLAATGDSFITRRLPPNDAQAARIAELLGAHDVRFTNFEVTTPNGAGFPAAQSGGTWAMAEPKVLLDLQRYGFNMMAWATNHTLDYSHGGLRATQRLLDEYGFVHAGAGENLAAASEVKYLECAQGRVALIAATSSFHESWRAGEQRPDMRGRPGVNPLRFVTTYRISAERMAQLQALAQMTGVNAERELLQQEGFVVATEPEIFQFGNLRFEVGAPEGETTKPHAGDLGRILRRVHEAKSQSDVVLVSIHAHEMKDGRKDRPAEFLTTCARACIDEGAHAVLGHGPHILRGLEIYKQRPIFYSLGNFIFQNETVSHLPADFYEKYGLGHNDLVSDAYDKRSDNNTKGLAVNPSVWHSVIASWTMRGGEIKDILLHPIEMGFGLPRYAMGWPQLTEKTEALRELQELSRSFGTEILIENSVGRVALS